MAAVLVLIGTALAAQTPTPSRQIAEALRARDYAAAHALAAAALKENSKDPRLRTLDGLALSGLGQTQPALDSFRLALANSPDYIAALEGEAQLLYREHNQAAVPVLERLRQLRPADETTSAMLAVLDFERGDCQSGLAEYEHSHALLSSQRTALEHVGACFIRLHRPLKAVEVFKEVVALEPGDKAAVYNLAVAEWEAAHYANVIASLAPLASESSRDAEALDLLAEAYEASSDTPKAVETLRAAISADPTAARYYVDFADICLIHSSFQVGIDMLNFGLRHASATAPLYLARGILYAQTGQYEKSGNDFAMADELDPAISGISEAQGIAALQQNKFGQAEATLRERLRKTPDEPFLCYLLAETLVRNGAVPGNEKFQEALKLTSNATRLKPDFALARDLLSRLYIQEGKTSEAIEQSRLSMRADPTDQTALYHLILALRKAGKQAELPPLMAQLATLKQQSQAKESNERKYALVEGNSTKPPK